MRLCCYFFLLFLLLTFNIAAQQLTDTFHQNSRAISFSPYRFPVFAPGMVYLRNKDTVSVYLNYHYVRNEMQFIDEQGDTLILKEPLTVGKITIGDEEFYFNKDKWIQKIKTISGIILGYWTNVKVEVDFRRSGFTGYGKIWPSQFDYSNFQLNTKDFYFFGDAYGNFTRATRNNLLACFERQSPLIKQYLSNHSIDFNKLKDIQQVLRFCETLE